MWRGNSRSRRGAVVGIAVAVLYASACSGDDESGGGKGGSAGSAGAATGGSAGNATGGSAGSAAGGNAGNATGGNAGTGGAGRGGANTGGAGMAGDGMGGAGMAGGGRGGMAGAGMGGGGRGGMAGAGMGGGGRGGMAGAGGMAGGGMGGAGGMAGGGMAGAAGGMAGGGMGGAGAGGMAGGGMAGAGGAAGGGTGGSGGQAATNLFFSEYFEGTNATQQSAVEIFNAGTAPANLTQCVVRVYVNGMSSFMTILPNSTALQPNDVFVVCSTSIGASCDQISPTMAQVTGNDAVSLVCNGIDVMDVIGQTGNNPATGEWGTGANSTADNDLRRSCSTTQGDRIGNDPFSPSAPGWTGFAATSNGLGLRTCPGGG